MDFVHDQLADGRPFLALTVVDQFSGQSPVLECRHRFSGQDVAGSGHQKAWCAGVDHGGSWHGIYVTGAGRLGLCKGVKLDFIRPGKPTESGHIESFNGRLRDEFLNAMQVESPEDAQAKIEAWQIDCNRHPPHSSLGNLTPMEFARMHQEQRPSGKATL